MAPQGRERAIDLFRQHGAGEFVRHSERGKRNKQVRAAAPSFGQPVVAADNEDEIARFPLGGGDQGAKCGRIEGLAGGIAEDFTGRRMTLPEIEALGPDLTHFNPCIAPRSGDEIGRQRVGVRILGAADKVKVDFHLGSSSCHNCRELPLHPVVPFLLATVAEFVGFPHIRLMLWRRGGMHVDVPVEVQIEFLQNRNQRVEMFVRRFPRSHREIALE